MSFVENLLEWTKNIFLPYGIFGLFSLAFIEAIFFPIPPDILLITLSLIDPGMALLYALVATIGSVLGGIVGYWIGYYGGHYILEKFVSKKKIQKVHNLFQKYEAWAIFVAGFTPIPYKVFTISAGVFYVNFKKFVIASFLSRGLRFFIEAFLILLFGEIILNILTNYFDILSIIGVLLLILFYFSIKRYRKSRS